MMEETRHLEHLRFDCGFCGETIEAEGRDPCETLQATHYCPPQLPLEAEHARVA